MDPTVVIVIIAVLILIVIAILISNIRIVLFRSYPLLAA